MASTQHPPAGSATITHDAGIAVAPTRSLQVIREASELYSRVFGYSSRELSLNPKLLLAMAANGGTAIAATTADGTLVGFTYGFAGFDGTTVYHYSQAAFVAREMQGKGVGRMLKQAQRREALAQGITTMRWAFDPMLAHNAHFNFTVLGARGRWFEPRLYDDDSSARLIVEWQLDATSVPYPAPLPARALSSSDWTTVLDDADDTVLVPIPSPAAARALEPQHLAAHRAALSETLADLLARGYVATDCSVVDDTSALYRFTREPRP
jgi:predicted GNAT superfamily acetyltransferase